MRPVWAKSDMARDSLRKPTRSGEPTLKKSPPRCLPRSLDDVQPNELLSASGGNGDAHVVSRASGRDGDRATDRLAGAKTWAKVASWAMPLARIVADLGQMNDATGLYGAVGK